MKLFSDYHTHPQGHRVQPYTRELLQPWVDSARARGLIDIAFTDHDRYCAGVDFDVIARLREANPDMGIRAGIELDNDPVHSPAGRRWVEEHWDKLDFVLGSVHFLARDDEMFDSVPGARRSSPSATSTRSTLITFDAFARWQQAGSSTAWRTST